MPAAARVGDMAKQDAPHCHAPIHPPAPVPTPVPPPGLPLAIVVPVRRSDDRQNAGLRHGRSKLPVCSGLCARRSWNDGIGLRHRDDFEEAGCSGE